MQVKDLKDICKLVSNNGLIDEFIIGIDGHIKGVDAAHTFVADIEYKTEIEKEIGITNVKGVTEILSKFPDDTKVEILDNKLHIVNGDKFANIVTKNIEVKFTIPPMTEENYDVILESVDHNILNDLGKMRPQTIINELYYFYSEDNKLKFRVGEVDETNVGNVIGTPRKCNTMLMKLTMNVSECFKNITNTSNLMFAKGLMIVECKTEKYIAKYFLAPRVD